MELHLQLPSQIVGAVRAHADRLDHPVFPETPDFRDHLDLAHHLAVPDNPETKDHPVSLAQVVTLATLEIPEHLAALATMLPAEAKEPTDQKETPDPLDLKDHLAHLAMAATKVNPDALAHKENPAVPDNLANQDVPDRKDLADHPERTPNTVLAHHAAVKLEQLLPRIEYHGDNNSFSLIILVSITILSNLNNCFNE